MEEDQARTANARGCQFASVDSEARLDGKSHTSEADEMLEALKSVDRTGSRPASLVVMKIYRLVIRHVSPLQPTCQSRLVAEKVSHLLA